MKSTTEFFYFILFLRCQSHLHTGVLTSFCAADQRCEGIHWFAPIGGNTLALFLVHSGTSRKLIKKNLLNNFKQPICFHLRRHSRSLAEENST